jgi:hypothetical protein
MVQRKKLAQVLKVREAGEKDALLERKGIDQVVGERRTKVEDLRGRRKALLNKIHESGAKARVQALHNQDLNQLSALTGYGKRLKKELDSIDRELFRAEEDLRRALERAQLAEDEFIRARVEKRQVEQLMLTQEDAKRLQAAARDEMAQDEMSSAKSRK